MRSIIRSSFLWQVGGGFVLGTIGLVALQPAAARHTLVDHLVPHAIAER